MKIFFDMDETLLSTRRASRKEKGAMCLGDWWFISEANPHGAAAVRHARGLVGEDNVYVLTYGVEDYAHVALKVCGYSFDSDKIIAREQIHRERDANHDELYLSEARILIDNETPRFNRTKMEFLELTEDNYFQTIPFYGYEHVQWLEEVVDFINERYDTHEQ